MWSAPEAPEYNQWALNPSAYQDLSHEEIDWALLAQQWIKMKETYPKDQVPPAPPPPPLGLRKGEAVEERIENEGGEAPMDMETREESLAEDVPQWGPFNNWNQWDSWNQWNAGGKVGPPPSGPPGAPPFSFGSDPQSVFNDGPVPGTIDYNHGNAEHFAQDDKVNQIGGRPGIPNHGRPTAKHPDGLHHYPPGHPGQHSGPGYWSGSGPPGGPCDGPIGQPHLGPYTKHNRNLWKHGVPRPPRDRFGRDEKPKEEEEEEETVEVLDAAKRRHLPAWIRDGLEKMEREKQKKLDREREMKEREERLQQQRLEEEEEAAAIAAGAMPKRSKFESDSESESENKGAISMETRKSRFQSMDSPGVSPERSSRGRSPSVEKGPPKSREEVMQEVMMKVRQMLTLILLEVTNEEMRNIAEETYGKARMKAPATDLQKSPALASLTGRLGLGIYEDSDEESGTDNEVDAARQANGGDSDEDLRETIRRRKQDFVKIEREIEADLAEDEEKERRLKGGDEEDDDDDDDGDEPDEDGRNEEKSGRGGGSKNQAQVEHQKAGSNLHLKEHGLQEPSGNADLATSKDGDAPNHHSASRGSPGRSPNRESSRRGSSTDGHESSTSRSSSSRVSSRRKSSKRSRDSRKKERKSKDKKRQRSSSREDEKKSKSRRGSADSSRRGKSRSRSRSDSGSRRDRKHRDSSRESSRVGSRADRLGHRDSYRDRGRDRDRYRDYRERDRDRDSRRRRGGSRFRRSNSRGRSRSRSRGSRSRRSDSRSRRSSSRIRSHRRSRSRSVESRRRRDSSGSRSVSPSKNRRRRSRSRSRSRSHHKISRRRHSSESSSERSSGKKSRHRRRD